MAKKQLYRSDSDKMIAGVCGGIAEYFGLDSSLIRLLFILIILLGGSGLLIYVILWIILPISTQSEGEEMSKKMPDLEDTNTDGKSKKHIWGFFLIGIGAIMLLQNFGIAHLLYLDKTWPAIFVVLGLLIIAK
jgi:phage shock protein C